MDGQQFDRFTRAFGSSKSRRSILKGLAAAGVAAVFGTSAIQSSAAQTCQEVGEGCEADVDCCTGMCGNDGCFAPEEICSEVGGECGFSEDGQSFTECCEGLYCAGGVCNEPQETCADEGEACGGLGGDGLVECCGDLVCAENVCVVESTPDVGGGGDGISTLPSTGSGATVDESSWLIPVSIGAAAAAAAVAGKVIKDANARTDEA